MSLVQALILSVPLGAGGLDDFPFLARCPLTRVMVLITFAGVAVVLIALRWPQTRPYFSC